VKAVVYGVTAVQQDINMNFWISVYYL